MGQYAAMIRVIACIVAAAVLFVGGCRYGSLTVEIDSLKSAEESRQAAAKALEAEMVRSAELNGQVHQLLSRKPAKETIRELINASPSDCLRPDSITNGLRKEVDSANKAIAASRNGDSLQADTAGK